MRPYERQQLTCLEIGSTMRAQAHSPDPFSHHSPLPPLVWDVVPTWWSRDAHTRAHTRAGHPSTCVLPLPYVQVMLEILQHPDLVVQTEEQMLTFVLGYVTRHELEHDVVRQLFGHVRLAFLSNARLSQLLQEDAVPRDLLLEAMAARLQVCLRSGVLQWQGGHVHTLQLLHKDSGQKYLLL